MWNYKKGQLVAKTPSTSNTSIILDFIVIERMVLKKWEVVAIEVVEVKVVEEVNFFRRILSINVH